MHKFIITLTLLLLFSSCQPSNSSTPQSTQQPQIVTTPLDSSTLPPLNIKVQEFTTKLIKEMPSRFFISPLSIYTALYMAALGSANKSAQEFSHLLLDSSDTHQLDTFALNFPPIIEQLDKSNSVEFYSTIWPDKKLGILPSYVEQLARIFTVKVHSVDFSDPNTREIINKDVENKTHGRIKDLLPSGSIDALTRLVLINSIYFLEKWKKQFNPQRTKTHPFYQEDGKIVQQKFMYRQVRITGHIDEHLTFISLPYLNQRYEMSIIMPKQNFKKFKQNFSFSLISQIKKKAKIQKLHLYLPKWKSEMFYSLKEIMQKLGLKSVFLAGEADFSKTSTSNRVYISQIFHKTFLEVKEDGTEAAAATAIVERIKSMPRPEIIKTVKIDHPFLFIIYDNKLDLPLFIGGETF